ncbi:glycine/sarcosine/betaine reductase complex component C subunit alpha [Clostridium sp. JN-1]|uniref:glycine/sarcosine/betaine reductase complex component C subunit alpha n=1 Tax=Clostridium sp. JN-1 TaxID=2483110 RepID=UPI000F0BAD9E|nr:glycine/sarcosine/betaine reductase complex component C subunit alpha [Clostridium sp. JN-1]
MNQVKKMIAESFNEIADGIKSGSFKERLKIGLTLYGSEHGINEMIKAAKLAKSKYGDFDIVLIGPKVDCGFENAEVNDAKDGHDKMVELLEKGEIDGCVTQHFDFPIGVSTVGKLIAPANGKEVIIATTTGTTSTNRVEGMIRNSISGIAVAKSAGIVNPTVGILNIDGARKVERALRELQSNGYEIKFAESLRKDGGAVMRGNDILAGTPDVMVCDSLTGNLLIKIFSAYTTGGNYEVLGYGYGPGIGEDYDKLINIVSRASGAPLICEALKYCSVCAEGKVLKLAGDEFKKAQKAGLCDILKNTIEREKQTSSNKEEVKVPPKTVVTYAIPGIDILELDDACNALWKQNIYCESGMGCTGPVILVADDKSENAIKVLEGEGYK